MNTKLLRKVRDMILRRPKQFDMDDWLSDFIIHPKTGLASKPPHCGTCACIAGWAVTIAEKMTPGQLSDRANVSGILPQAKTALDLNDAQADRLFFLSCWPNRYSGDYFKSETFKSRAKIAGMRINEFIRSKGAR